MALDAPPIRSLGRVARQPGVARRHAGLAVCGGVVALVVAVGVHQASRPVPPQAASVLATEPIVPVTPAATAVAAPASPATTAAPPVTVAAPVPATTAAPAVPAPVATAAPVVAVTTVTAPERVFPLGVLCWPLGASARSAAGTPIMCTRLDPAGQAYPDGHARWRRS